MTIFVEVEGVGLVASVGVGGVAPVVIVEGEAEAEVGGEVVEGEIVEGEEVEADREGDTIEGRWLIEMSCYRYFHMYQNTLIETGHSVS